ncbi:MAG: N-acetylmuramoyl-L-alanine amidase [Candidatus Solibacter usitatus]|nr:N-acetylmuramoyl-L-alanine amidase [Candidatus Solibacter usitatus]
MCTTNQPLIDRTAFRLNKRCFFDKTNPKDLIVLHFTAGSSARSAFETWRSAQNGVSAPYIVDTDGRIYETFEPAFWSFHLGVQGEPSRRWTHDKRSVGIEIVNAGPLKLDGERMLWWPGNFSSEFCKTNQEAAYLRQAYRGFDYWAVFTEAQRLAVSALTGHLCRRFGIPAQLASETKRVQFDLNYFATFKGIAAHQNFRPDKFDIGPAWNWKGLDLPAL